MSNIVTPILLLIASIGLIFTYLKPAYNNLVEFQEQEREIKAAIEQADSLVGQYKKLRDQRTSILSDDEDNLLKILPDAIDVVGMIIDIDTKARRRNLDVIAFEVPVIPTAAEEATQNKSRRNTNSDENPLIGSAVLSVEFQGEYVDFKNFIIDIERNMWLTDIESISIEVADIKQPKTEEGITYKLGLRSYWLKEQY